MIEDIRFYKGKVYVLKDSKINSQQIEDKLSTFSYTGQRRSLDKNVESSNIPYFAIAFFYFIFDKDEIPTEEEFYKAYLQLNNITEESDHLNINGKLVNKDGVQNRLLRAYPSLIRDFHFFKLCQESNRFQNVKFSTRLDIYEGIDLIIEFNNIVFCVAIYTDTQRAIYYKQKKNSVRHDYQNCNHQIELKIDLSVTNGKVKRVSNFILLTNEYISEIENRIKEYDGVNE